MMGRGCEFFVHHLQIRRLGLQKYTKTFATYLRNIQISNNQDVDKSQIISRGSMRNQIIPPFGFGNHTEEGTRNAYPMSWQHACKDRSRIKLCLLDGERGRKLQLLIVHAVLLQSIAVLSHLMLAVCRTTIVTSLGTTIICPHHHPHLIGAKTMHNRSTHTEVDHHQREQRSKQYVEQASHHYPLDYTKNYFECAKLIIFHIITSTFSQEISIFNAHLHAY